MSGQDPEIITFGCRLNAWESEVMRDHARAAGLRRTVIINTCAVTAEAERQARQAIRKARRADPRAHLIVTGCAVQIAPARYAAMTEVDQVLGNEEKLRRESFLPDPGRPRIAVGDIMAARETAAHLIDGFAARTRAFVQVQQGCDHRCTFCVIPHGRGNSRSVPMGAVIEQVRALVGGGVAEVVLTGVDLTAYGQDLPGRPSLGGLARRILALVPDLLRLRLSSIDAVEMDDELLALLAEEPRLMPHLHLSLQSGDDTILKRMKRRHTRADAARLVERIRDARCDVVLGADLIAGFPTETEAMFANTQSLIADLGLTYLHVFPYSPRPGTPAARMPQVPVAVRKERAARLRDLGAAALAKYLDTRVGTRARVLIEREGLGRSEQFALVAVDGGAVGAVVPAMITARRDDRLVGRLAA